MDVTVVIGHRWFELDGWDAVMGRADTDRKDKNARVCICSEDCRKFELDVCAASTTRNTAEIDKQGSQKSPETGLTDQAAREKGSELFRKSVFGRRRQDPFQSPRIVRLVEKEISAGFEAASPIDRRRVVRKHDHQRVMFRRVGSTDCLKHVQAAAILQLHVEHECIALHGRQFVDRVLSRSAGANDLDTRKSTQRLDQQIAQEGGVLHQVDLEWMSRYHGEKCKPWRRRLYQQAHRFVKPLSDGWSARDLRTTDAKMSHYEFVVI